MSQSGESRDESQTPCLFLLLLLHVCLPFSFKTPLYISLSFPNTYITIYFSLSVSFDQRDFEEWITKEFGLVWLFRGVLYRYEWLYINSCDSTLYFSGFLLTFFVFNFLKEKKRWLFFPVLKKEKRMKNEEQSRSLFGISLSDRPTWQQFLICTSGFFFGYLVNGVCEVLFIIHLIIFFFFNFGFYSFRGSRIIIDNVDHFCLFAEIIQHNYLLIMVH